MDHQVDFTLIPSMTAGSALREPFGLNRFSTQKKILEWVSRPDMLQENEYKVCLCDVYNIPSLEANIVFALYIRKIKIRPKMDLRASVINKSKVLYAHILINHICSN